MVLFNEEVVLSKYYASVKFLINGENVSHCIFDDVGSVISVFNAMEQ